MARQMIDSGIEWIGEIPETWEAIKAKYLAHINHGTDPTTEGDTPVYGSGAESFKTCGEYKEGPTVLIGRKGATLHIPHYVEGRYWNVDTAFDVKVNNKYVLRMYYYAATCFDYKYYMSQTTLPGMTQTNYNNMALPCPSLLEQQRIAAFLDRKCAEIDAIIERTKTTIEEYKKLKQAVITEAVTKGVRGPRPMKDSGIEWIGEIPEGWEVNRIKYVSDFEPGCSKDGLTDGSIITYTPMDCIKNGWFINNTAPLGSVSSSLTAYQEGDIVMAKVTPCFENGNIAIMCGLASGFGLGSSELFVIRPTEIETKYMFYWLRNTVFMQRACATMTGTGGLKRVSPSFVRDCFIHMPPSAEQAEIAAYLDEKCAALDTLIAKKTALLTELETYKKSLIYEYVTGKKAVPVAAQPATAVYPFYPAVLNTKVLRFAQAVLMARILDRHGKGIGRVKLEKMLYTIEASIGFDFDTEYVREAAGPLHESLYKCEGIISRQNKWYQLRSSGHSVAYIPTTEAAKYQKYYDKYFSDYDAEIERLINIFKPYDTDQAEVIATLFGAWNDAIIAGTPFTDEDIVDDILANWHERKKRFPRDMWLRALNEMRKKNLIPKGYGKKTVRRVAE